jgi:hypothetical protein
MKPVLPEKQGPYARTRAREATPPWAFPAGIARACARGRLRNDEMQGAEQHNASGLQDTVSAKHGVSSRAFATRPAPSPA